MDSLQLSSDSAIFQSLVDYLSSSSVTVDAKLSFLRPTLRWLSNNLIATSLDIASYLELQNKLIQVSDMVVSCKSDLLSVWNPVMVTGLNLYSGEIFTTILKLWNTYFTRKGVFYGPFSQDLIDIVNYIKREVRVKLKIPKQFPLVATRTSSRLGSRSSKSPVVPRQISSVNSPPETFDESSLESPIAKRTTGLENSNPVSISSIMLTPPGLEKNKKSTKLFEPTPSGDRSTGVKSLSLSELRSKQIFIDQAQEMKKDSLSLHSDEIHSSHDLEYSSQKDMGISSTNSDANDKDDTSFLISVSFAGTSDSHITEKLDYGEDSSGIQLHDTVSDTMQDKVPDTIVAVETTTFGPTENSESKILASRKLVIDETELVDTVRENYSEVLNTVESFESISSNESVGEVQETDHHSQKSSGVIDESESNVESLCNDSNEIETRPHEKFEEKGQDIDFENHNTHIDVQEGEQEEVSPVAKVSLVSIKEANIGTESIEISAKMVTTNETVINTNNNSQKSFCLSLERNRSDRSQSRSPIPTSFTSELQVNEHNAVQGLIPIRDMQKLDNVSDYAEGFRKRKRSPKVKSKKLLGELKRKKLDNVDDSRRSHLSDLQRVLSNMDWAANDSATKEDYFQMETSLMDALIKIRKRTIAKSVITNTGS